MPFWGLWCRQRRVRTVTQQFLFPSRHCNTVYTIGVTTKVLRIKGVLHVAWRRCLSLDRSSPGQYWFTLFYLSLDIRNIFKRRFEEISDPQRLLVCIAEAGVADTGVAMEKGLQVIGNMDTVVMSLFERSQALRTLMLYQAKTHTHKQASDAVGERYISRFKLTNKTKSTFSFRWCLET